MSSNKNTQLHPKEILENEFVEVMSDLTYMFAEPAGEDLSFLNTGHNYMLAQISFNSKSLKVSGDISLICPKTLCEQIAKNVLGMGSEESDSGKEEDVLKELLNITCGKFLTGVYGDKPIFNLSIPVVNTTHATEWEKIVGNNSSIFVVDENMPLIVYLSLTNE